MCNIVADDNPNALEFVPECCKTQKMCDKAVVTSSTKFVPQCYKTQEI